MKIGNLEVGMILKSYKQLCEVLEESVTAGNSKKSQIKEWERYFKYHKDGNKFIIDEIYTTPLPKVDNRDSGNNKTKYIDEIESLILNLLSEMQEYNGTVFLSKYLLLKQLKMINENYSFCKRRISKLSSFTKISEENIYEFYDSADSTLVRNLEKALDSLNDKCLIIWSKEITICEAIDLNDTIIDEVSYDVYDEEIHNYTRQLSLNHRQATDSEARTILFMEKEVIEEMGFNTKRDIAINNMWKTFSRIMSEKIKGIGIAYYYKSYKVLFNEEHIDEALIDNSLLSSLEKLNTEDLLNGEIINKLKTNTTNRHLKAIDKIENNYEEDINIKKYTRRSEEVYLKDNYRLTDLLVNSSMGDIRKLIKVQKS